MLLRGCNFRCGPEQGLAGNGVQAAREGVRDGAGEPGRAVPGGGAGGGAARPRSCGGGGAGTGR